MLKSRQPIHVHVLRGGQIESQHEVVATFWNPTRGLVGFSGNTEFLTFPRSAIKMLQALPLVESGAFDHYQLPESMLAFACSSHRAESIHIELAKKWCEMTGLTESQLACGPQIPSHPGSAENLVRQNQKPGRFHNNCSGKHLGFLTTSLFLKENLNGYHEESHPNQRRVRQVLSDAMKIDFQKLHFGIDGCGIPTFGIPLQNISRGMSILIDEKQPMARKKAAQRIVEACLKYPELLSGTDDWLTVTMKNTTGKVLLKAGAEGVLCGLLPESEIGFTLKAIDGNPRAVQTVTYEILKYYGVLKADVAQKIWGEHGGIIKNTRDEVVGEVRVLTKND